VLALETTLLAGTASAGVPEQVTNIFKPLSTPAELISAHSIGFSGKGYHRSSKASRREDLQVEEPVACGNCASFHFHATLAGMLGPTLIGDQVVEVCQPREKRLLAPFGMMEAFHREQLPLDGIMGLIQQGAGCRHLRVGKDCIPAGFTG
jgi:hypothetical protein